MHCMHAQPCSQVLLNQLHCQGFFLQDFSLRGGGMYMCPTGKCVHQCTDYGFVDFKYFVIVLYILYEILIMYDNMERTGWQLQVIYKDCDVTSKKILSCTLNSPPLLRHDSPIYVLGKCTLLICSKSILATIVHSSISHFSV